MAITNSTIGPRRFKYLTAYDRGKIATLHAAGKIQREIANYIGCHKSMISRELKRGTVPKRKSDGKKFMSIFLKQESLWSQTKIRPCHRVY